MVETRCTILTTRPFQNLTSLGKISQLPVRLFQQENHPTAGLKSFLSIRHASD